MFSDCDVFTHLKCLDVGDTFLSESPMLSLLESLRGSRPNPVPLVSYVFIVSSVFPHFYILHSAILHPAIPHFLVLRNHG